jgi:hypothetical protein
LDWQTVNRIHFWGPVPPRGAGRSASEAAPCAEACSGNREGETTVDAITLEWGYAKNILQIFDTYEFVAKGGDDNRPPVEVRFEGAPPRLAKKFRDRVLLDTWRFVNKKYQAY